MKFFKMSKKKLWVCIIIIIIIVIFYLYKSRSESFYDIENFDNTPLISPNYGHSSQSMLRYGLGTSVSSSGMTKPQGLCCQHHGCITCGGKYAHQKKYGCKKWVRCEKLSKPIKHEYQNTCTGCGADKESILGSQMSNWW